MSSGDELLGEDELGIDDSALDVDYNLGNEEEELLLAGGGITDVVDGTAPQRPKEAVPNVSAAQNEENNDLGNGDAEEHSLKPKSESLIPEKSDDAAKTTNSQCEQRYRAGQSERFPTERSDRPLPIRQGIPDSLDTVVSNAEVNASFSPRKNFNHRGRRRGNFNGPQRREGGYDKKFDSFGNNLENGSYNRDNFPPGNWNPEFGFNHRAPYDRPHFNRFGYDGPRPMDSYSFDRRFPNANFDGGSGPLRPPGTFGPDENGYNPNFAQNRGFKSNGQKPHDNFRGDIPFNSHPVDAFGPPPMPMPNLNVPPSIDPLMENNAPFPPGPNPARGDAKKVLINPHFKGPVNMPHVLQHSQPPNLDKYVEGAPPFIGNTVNLQMSEQELDRATRQFIEEQQRCLRAAAKDDYYEKTQRFIESTSIDVKNRYADDTDPRKEYLKRKQEEFINENRLNLKRRRDGSPGRPPRRVSPNNRVRTSPTRRIRAKSSRSPPPVRESSEEPEERAYRAKLREQAEMRAKLLQAKERRRRRDAANLNEKLNQKLSSLEKEEKEEASAMSTPTKDEREVDYEKENLSEIPLNNQQPTMQTTENPANDKSDDNATQDNECHETLDDMLEDDLLRLSPEEEDLLLSDDDDFSMPISSSLSNKVKILGSSKSQSTMQAKKEDITINKSTLSKSNANLKKSSDNMEDLRKKLSKPTDNSSQINPSTRKRIVFSSNSDEKNKSTDIKTNENDERKKWRSTFSEQKLDLTAQAAVRAISAVMRGPSDNKKVVASITSKSQKTIPSKENDKFADSKSDGKSWNGRQVLLGNSGRRVVIPPTPQKPLVIIEDDEPETRDETRPEKNIKNKKSAHVNGLPPGMTEARLLSLCGPDVERVNVDGAGNADVFFNSIVACQRFERRFNGRLVAACRLTVTVRS